MPLPECRDCPNLPARQGVFTVAAEARIAASADRVFAILTEWSKHPEFVGARPGRLADADRWDTFTQSITFARDGLPALGDRAVMHVKMTAGMPALGRIPIEVTYADAAERKIAWKSRLAPSFILRTERVLEVVEDGAEACIFRTWETQGGSLAHVVRTAFLSLGESDVLEQVKAATGATLDRAFERVVGDLKRRVEGTPS